MRDFTKSIQEFHNRQYKVVLSVTGGGSEAISELLRYGGASATVLEAVIPYSTQSLEKFIEGKPDKFCSKQTARAMAVAGFQRARELAPSEPLQNLIGLGCTASLAKANEREGRKHKAYIVAHTEDATTEHVLEFADGLTRTEEETTLAEEILESLFYQSFVREHTVPGLHNAHYSLVLHSASPGVADLVNGMGKIQPLSRSIGYMPVELPPEMMLSRDRFVFPGSFNPFHKNHREMVQWASKQGSVHLEMSVSNVDKLPLDFLTIFERLQAIDQIGEIDDVFFLTHAPTFVEKAAIFQGSKFLVGGDTILRIADPKYGNLQKVKEIFEWTRIKFIVFGRKDYSLEDELPDWLLNICKIVPESEYKDDGTSSSKIRALQHD